VKKIVLISCTLEKLDCKSKVKDLYSPSLNFNKHLDIAKSLSPDKILVISAKHHVLELEEEIEPYDMSIDKFSGNKQIDWGIEVIKQLKNKKINLEYDEIFTILPDIYLRLIKPYIKKLKLY
tara:strand:- start:88 stop:453 length:366 start_codon:yes stop_codon:yes gene_type:complete